MRSICLDASLAVDILLATPLQERLLNLWTEWAEEPVYFVVPELFHAEVMSGIRRQMYRKQLTPAEAELAYQELCSLTVDTVGLRELMGRVWELANQFAVSHPYDLFYLALAEREAIECWTTDKRFANLVGGRFRQVRLVGA